jgi:hydrogenase nickel incorporation protein HypA/HybF
MHEMALAEGILAVVLDAAKDQRVVKIQLQAGRLQAIVPDSLQFSFQLIAEGTSAANARVELKEIPLRMRCNNCTAEDEYSFPPSFCVHCRATDFVLVSGDELIVDSVQLDTGDIIQRPSDEKQDELQDQIREHVRHDHTESH